MRSRRVAMATLFATALCAPDADAVIPQGNTVLNGGGETGAAAGDETSHICPQGWTCDSTFPNTTLLRYGVTTFPGTSESARIGGGGAFFAGGPNNNLSGARQSVALGEQPEFDAGGVKATFGGCLGGFGNENDHAIVQFTFLTREDPDGNSPANTFALTGPNAAARGGKTGFRPVAQTVASPPETQGFRLTLSFVRDGTSPYNDGYADNLSVTFGAASGANPPAPACSVPAGGGGGGGGPGPGGPGGGGKPLKLLGFAQPVLGKDGRLRLRVSCNTSKVSRCKGKASAVLVSAGKRRGLGSVRYSVAKLKTQSVKIRLKPKALKAIRGLSRRALAKARIKLRATTTVAGVKFTQTASLKVRRPG